MAHWCSTASSYLAQMNQLRHPIRPFAVAKHADSSQQLLLLIAFESDHGAHIELGKPNTDSRLVEWLSRYSTEARDALLLGSRKEGQHE